MFAACTIISSFASGNTVQAFTVADSFQADFGLPPYFTGLLLSILVGLVIIGGIKRIGVVASRLVPFMALIYIVSSLVVIGSNIQNVPEAFRLVFTSAFTPQGAIGGFAGSTFTMALLWGVRRGLFSNESGQGSAPIAHAAAKTEEPVREGTVAMVGPFIDTLLICTLTGLTIITSGAWKTTYETSIPLAEAVILTSQAEVGPGGTCRDEDRFSGEAPIRRGEVRGVRIVYNNGIVEDPTLFVPTSGGKMGQLTVGHLVVQEGKVQEVQGPASFVIEGGELRGGSLLNGSLLTAKAFETGLGGKWGSWMVTFAVFLFALSTAISWSYYGDRGSEYLFGGKGIRSYRLLFVILVFLGANLQLKTVWGFGDIALSMMAFPNLIALLLLAGKVKRSKEEYFSREHVPVSKAHF
ncbi:MAG TPA: amino acid carrier protein [Bacteroidetes bacterium]|nr:amino acid carrier protein [Bacteroidota bacterium]